jgi:hypothetical protein
MFVPIGWEYHSYLLQVREGHVTIYEPTDNVVTTWQPGMYGIRKFKVAYAVTVKQATGNGGHPVPVHQPVTLKT